MAQVLSTLCLVLAAASAVLMVLGLIHPKTSLRIGPISTRKRLLLFYLSLTVLFVVIGTLSHQRTPEAIQPDRQRADEMQQRIARLEAKARAIPSSDYQANLTAYGELLRLDPSNERFKQKVSYYRGKLQSRDEPQEPDVVHCGRFAVSHRIADTHVEVKLDTDLPGDTRLIVGVKRYYYEKGSPDAYVQDYYSAIDERTADWQTWHHIPLDHGKWRADLEDAMNRNASLGMWEGLASVGDSVEIAFSVPAYGQTNARLGELNSHLRGDMVTVAKTVRGQARSVEWRTAFHCPTATELPKASAASPERLRRGEQYMVSTGSDAVPLMAAFDPEDPWSALPEAKSISGSFSIRVREVRIKGSSPWYRVDAYHPSGESIGSGWINSIALMGTALRRQN